MNGSWHRYRPGERWRRPPSRARLVLEVPGAVAVCFDAPVVELFEQRAEALHPSLGAPRAGPARARLRRRRGRPPPPRPVARRRCRSPRRSSTSGRSPASATSTRTRSCGSSGSSPFARVADLDDATLDRLVATARRLLVANVARAGPGARHDRRRPRRAGSALRLRPDGPAVPPLRDADPSSTRQGDDIPRTTYWCPTCQGAGP